MGGVKGMGAGKGRGRGGGGRSGGGGRGGGGGSDRAPPPRPLLDILRAAGIGETEAVRVKAGLVACCGFLRQTSYTTMAEVSYDLMQEEFLWLFDALAISATVVRTEEVRLSAQAVMRYMQARVRKDPGGWRVNDAVVANLGEQHEAAFPGAPINVWHATRADQRRHYTGPIIGPAAEFRQWIDNGRPSGAVSLEEDAPHEDENEGEGGAQDEEVATLESDDVTELPLELMVATLRARGAALPSIEDDASVRCAFRALLTADKQQARSGYVEEAAAAAVAAKAAAEAKAVAAKAAAEAKAVAAVAAKAAAEAKAVAAKAAAERVASMQRKAAESRAAEVRREEEEKAAVEKRAAAERRAAVTKAVHEKRMAERRAAAERQRLEREKESAEKAEQETARGKEKAERAKEAREQRAAELTDGGAPASSSPERRRPTIIGTTHALSPASSAAGPPAPKRRSSSSRRPP